MGEIRDTVRGCVPPPDGIRGSNPITADTPPPLNPAERYQLDLIRRFGTIGALLMALGSLGAGAAPVYNPVLDLRGPARVLSLFPRMPTVALACAFAGMGMVVLGWLWLGRFVRPGRPRLLSRTQLNRTLLMWAVPLAVIPPMFSRDVYSYLAQCKIAALGMDPYQLSPAAALGNANPLVRGIPTIWRDTPAPYGPLFLSVCRGVPGIAGDHVMSGVLLQRLLELVGVALIVWALPRLARRFGVQPVSALWLGAANPLVLWHLVIGAHNEALMIGLMLAGLAIAIGKLPQVSPGDRVPPLTRIEVAHLLAGAIVITLGAGMKISAAPALAFLGVLVARRLGGRFRHLVLTGLILTLVFGIGITAMSLGSGLGFGWVNTFNVANTVKSWMSPPTAVGYLTACLGLLLGIGNHTDATIATARLLGIAGYVTIGARIIWLSFKGRIQPMIGLGLFLGVVVILGATVQAWYFLWAIIPLAAGVSTSRFRTVAAALSTVVALVATFPTGTTFNGHVYVLPEAYAAALVVIALTVLAVRRRIPLLPQRGEAQEWAPEKDPRDGGVGQPPVRG